MNHILKKVIQCVVSIFCVLGMISTTGKSIKAEGGSIYSDYGNRTCDYSGCKPANDWKKSTNLSGSGSYYLAYSKNENDDITTSELAPIDASKVFLTNNNGDTPVDTTNVIHFSPNYIELNLDNLAVGEYTLKIEDSSMKVVVEKSYVVLKDSDGNEYTLNQSYPFNLNVGTKYTLEKVYKQTVNDEIKYTISAVSDDKGNLNIVNDGSYTIEPKAEYEDPWGNLEIKTNEGPSLWFSYQVCKPAGKGTIQINDDNSFIITFEDDKVLDSISQQSELLMNFSNNNWNSTFVLKGGIKNDADNTLTFDSQVLKCSGGYAPKGLYDVSLQQMNNTESNTWNLKGNGEGGKVTLNHDINKEIPDGLSYSLTKEDGFKITCTESDACTAYLDTFYDTNVNSQDFINSRYWSSVVYGYTNGQPINVPQHPNKPQLFKKITKNDKTIALTVPYKSFIKNSNTGFNFGKEYSLTIHVLGYRDLNFNEKLKDNYDFPDKLPEGWIFDVEWDEETKTIKYFTNHKELFEDTDQFMIDEVNNKVSTNISLSDDYKYTITESDGLYYLLIEKGNSNTFDSFAGYTFTVKLFNYNYGKIQAENTITVPGTIEERKNYPNDLVIKIIADGIVVKTTNTEFIEDAIKDNLSIVFSDSLLSVDSIESYPIDNTKYRFKKINDTQVKLDITAEELTSIKNEKVGATGNLNIYNSYYPILVLKNYVRSNENNTYFKASFKPIILADAIGKTNSADELKKLDGYATGLENVTVKDEETNNTGVSIAGNVAGAITENYEKGNENSDLNLLPESENDKEIITIKTDVKSLDAKEADELASKAGGKSSISIDVSISKAYTKDSSKNTEVTELPYDSNLTFNLSETNENETYVVVREHKESDEKTSYTLLDVTENKDGTGSVSSNKFSKFALVKQKILEMLEAPKGSTNEGSKTSLKFKTMVKATNVYLDNELIDPNNYEAEDDGTVTLKPEYVSKLSVGKHTLKIITKEGMASSEFEISAKSKGDNNTSSSVETKGWDDGGPFTTDKCGNVFDRWGNKIYEANGCNVGGYNLVRTDTID